MPVSSPAGARRRLGEAALVLLLLAVYAGLTLSAVRRKSMTFDELFHITTGYAHWRTGDYHFHPENGLAQEWAALGLLPGSWDFPSLEEEPWSERTAFQVGKHFFYEMGNDADAMLFRVRAMEAVLGAALGLVVYGWSRQLFGPAGGLVSLALFATCPTVLAHGPLVTADMAAALFFTASLWALWRLLHRVTPVTVVASGLALSGLFLSKMSAVILVPAAVVLAVVRLALGRPLTVAWRDRAAVVEARARQALVLAGVALGQALLVWAAVWAFFDFRYDAVRGDGSRYEYATGWPYHLETPGPVMQAVGFVREHRLLPEAYLFSFAAANTFGQSRVAFLNGDYSTAGRLAFFPYCLLVKTPPALFALLGLATAAVVARGRFRREEGRLLAYEVTPLVVFFVVFWCFALASNLNIGHRHLLPVYPILYVVAGGAGLWLRRPGGEAERAAGFIPAGAGPAAFGPRGGRATALVAVCLLVALGEALWTWPHYLAYFNLLAGGPRQGYKHLVDSSLDWGQDLKELAWRLDERGVGDSAAPVYLSYFGSAVPEYYGIRATPLPSFFPRKLAGTELTGGTYCISATMLQGLYFRSVLFRGRWGPEQEKGYRMLLQGRQRLAEIHGDRDALGELLKRFEVTTVEGFHRLYEEARFARLCAVLRRRPPDDMVGYSILLYQLTDAEVERALRGSAPYEESPGAAHGGGVS